MRAFVIDEPGVCGVRELAAPRARPGEVVAAVEAVGICGSDVELLSGRRPPPYFRYPIVPGHEWVGTIVENAMAPGAPDLGTTVVAAGIRSCGRCARCREGRANLCTASYAETGFTEPGALAELIAVPASALRAVRTPPGYATETAALLEPAACVSTGLEEIGGLAPGAALAVVGDGTLGQIAVALGARAGLERLTLVGTRAERLDLGRALGATAVVSVAADALEHELGGYDVVFEASGSPDGAATAVALARRGGSVVLAGVSGSGRPSIDPDAIATRHLRVQGVFGATPRAWDLVAKWWSSGDLDLSALVAARVGLADAEAAIRLVEQHALEGPKVLVLPMMKETR